MTETRMMMPVPPSLDPITLGDGRFSIRFDTDHGEVLAHYDPARRIGATFVAQACVWSMWWPLSFDGFLAGIARFRPREATGFDVWAAACDPAGTAGRMQ